MNFKLKLFIPLLSVALFLSACKDEDPKPFKQHVHLDILHEWNDSPLVLNQAYIWNHGVKSDTITPTRLIYHINNLELLTEDSQVITAAQTYYMIDYGANEVLPEKIHFTTPTEGVKHYVNAIEFTVGIADSLASATGTLNSLFVSPMYWGMISGYINFKFEALTPKTPLIYHIGGYKKPYYNWRRVRVVFNKPYFLNEDNTLRISADLLKLFDSATLIDTDKITEVQMPNANSKIIADNMGQLFSFKDFR